MAINHIIRDGIKLLKLNALIDWLNFSKTGSMAAVPTAFELVPAPTKPGVDIAVMEPTTLPTPHGDFCIFKGRKYAFNEKIEDGCERLCKCMASSATVSCEPRCPKMNHTKSTHEQCVTVPDPKDLCCHIELCDVTLDDHEQGGAIAIVPAPPSFDAMKMKKGNYTTNLKSSDYKERASTAASAIAAATEHDPNQKYDCEHNGNKYTIGMRKIYKEKQILIFI